MHSHDTSEDTFATTNITPSPGESLGKTRREFLEAAAVTGVAVGILATTPEAHAGDEPNTTPNSSNDSRYGIPGISSSSETISRWQSQTLLNSQGRLRTQIPTSRYQSWVKELKSLSVRVSSRRSALLNLWIGEYAMTTGQDPRKALHHFRIASERTKRDDALYGWASYNECLALLFDSQYNAAAEHFATLLYGHKKTDNKPLHGFDW